jgi:hypothetical protein
MEGGKLLAGPGRVRGPAPGQAPEGGILVPTRWRKEQSSLCNCCQFCLLRNRRASVCLNPLA